MTLLANWREVLHRAWSVRLMVLAAFMSGIEVVIPLLDGYVDIQRGIFAVLSFIATAGAFAARLIAQNDLAPDDAKSTEAADAG